MEALELAFDIDKGPDIAVGGAKDKNTHWSEEVHEHLTPEI